MPFRARSLRTTIVVLLGVMLVACGTLLRLAYNQADHLAYWKLNKAFDFNESQSVRVKAVIGDWFQWHRRTQLPVYAQFTARASKEARGELSPELACERRDELEGWSKAALDRALPAVAEIVLTLTPGQLKHLEEYNAKKSKEFRKKYLQKNPEDRAEAAQKFAEKWTGFFYGNFDRDQRAFLGRSVAQLPVNAQDVYDETVQHKAAFVQTVRSLIARKATAAQAQVALHDMFHEMLIPTTEPRRSKVKQWISAGCKMASAVHQQATPEQRGKASERLDSWHRDLLMLTSQR